MSDWRKYLDYEYVTVTELGYVLDGLNTLIINGQFDEVNAIYSTVKLDIDQSVLVAIIRFPYRIRHLLPDWRAFTDRVLEEIPDFGDQGLRENT